MTTESKATVQEAALAFLHSLPLCHPSQEDQIEGTSTLM